MNETVELISKIPDVAAQSEIFLALKAKGILPLSRGKVRDTYEFYSGGVVKNLVIVATDRISIHDFVLPVLIPGKGEVLTALTHFWLMFVLDEYPNHLVTINDDSNGTRINFINHLSKRIPVLSPKRCLMVKDLSGKMDPYELIFRHHIGGSVYKKYLKTGRAGGHSLPLGLPKWSKLSEPIFTPSTKEEVGHDINIDADYYYEKMGKSGKAFADMLQAAYAKAYDYASTKGILIVDTKFEGSSERRIIADEVLTPDSSRFVDTDNFNLAMANKVEPAFLDKQPLRDWGATIETPFGVTGLNKLDPSNEEHLKFVHNLKVPAEEVEKISQIYQNIFFRLVGMSLKEYQKTKMMI